MPSRSDTWTDWYDAHARALLLLARQWAPNPADAEDIVQEAFVKFWRTRDTVNDPAAYLFTCVRRTAIDHGRTTGRRRQRERVAAAGRPDHASFEPAGSRDDDERRAQLESALAQLPLEQRETLVMKLWGGLTFDAIGAALGVSPNTAASRYRYALAALRAMLEPEVTA